MNSQIKISIPEPCHEDWNKMIPNEKGRYCSACAKGVVDFTSKSKEEIQAYFIQNQGKKVCGRLSNEQLNRFDVHIPAAVLREQRSFHKAFLLALFVVMGTSLFSCKNHSNEQLGDVVVVEDSSIPKKTMGKIIPRNELTEDCNKITVGQIDLKKYDSLVKAGVIIPPPPPPPPVKEIKFKKQKTKNKKVPPPPPVAGMILYELIPDSTKTEKN
jgi:hypothetical protein